MDKTGFIEIRITGTKGNLDLTPDTYDVREVIAVLEQVEGLLFPADKKDRPTISYQIQGGSVRHIFKTAVQYIIGFNALIGLISQRQDIDFLESATAKSFEELQEIAIQRAYTLNIRTSEPNSNELLIDRTTKFYRTEAVWAEAEFYLYGRVTNAGGKDRANIHIQTDDYGLVIIKTPISVLEHLEGNILYRTFGVRVIGRQHTETGELDRSDIRFVELIDYHPTYDEDYLQSLRSKAKKKWLGSIEPDAWLRELRGSYDA
ncbi:hypothetical protein GO730_25320 [Spirosoma sp. HMF3257]|uniref:Uncharacterized protein n=1 Tax=Spirosoma telluris TaxID=2183553 RepID=A0A327NUY1_9BACT|nr:hypothetical protein [Spirosoma telluris]RAI76648.1 hypothetical protein HMF3257_25255 [Spirosoma telluris]